jgi:hypothetical protein
LDKLIDVSGFVSVQIVLVYYRCKRVTSEGEFFQSHHQSPCSNLIPFGSESAERQPGESAERQPGVPGASRKTDGQLLVAPQINYGISGTFWQQSQVLKIRVQAGQLAMRSGSGLGRLTGKKSYFAIKTKIAH